MVNLSHMGKVSGRFRRGGKWVKVSTQRTEAKEGFAGHWEGSTSPGIRSVCDQVSQEHQETRGAWRRSHVGQPAPTGPTPRCGFYACATRVKSLGQTPTSPMV